MLRLTDWRSPLESSGGTVRLALAPLGGTGSGGTVTTLRGGGAAGGGGACGPEQPARAAAPTSAVPPSARMARRAIADRPFEAGISALFVALARSIRTMDRPRITLPGQAAIRPPRS
ncbi:hypothetical protein NUTIK01_29420 [Novosphingobium sp. IK01]|uniref:Uncharacterized protein n=1 Tax=Novosphingobium pituita TaxID=3056842 RepID=A0ABQ6PBB0_9SPHN|nr:hypothetical protein NUTIK01_29420 [Novosphingobium sp. IK01]